MSTAYRLFPDSEALAGFIMREAETGANGVYSSLPSNPNYPVITVKRIGGIPPERHALDAPTLQVEVWGNNKGEAHDIAQKARVAMHEAEGTGFLTDDPDEPPVNAFVTGVDDSTGLMWIPDEPTGRDRYIFRLTMYLH